MRRRPAPSCAARDAMSVLLVIVKEDGRYWLGFDRLRCLEIA